MGRTSAHTNRHTHIHTPQLLRQDQPPQNVFNLKTHHISTRARVALCPWFHSHTLADEWSREDAKSPVCVTIVRSRKLSPLALFWGFLGGSYRCFKIFTLSLESIKFNENVSFHPSYLSLSLLIRYFFSLVVSFFFGLFRCASGGGTKFGWDLLDVKRI